MSNPRQPSLRPLFPPIEMADEHGLLMTGGELNTHWLLSAYRSGIFPWPFDADGGAESLAWFSPNPRAIIELEAFHVSRRLAATIRSGRFQIGVNRNFHAVIESCASAPGRENATWITPEMIAAYSELHEQNWAHSVEVYENGELAGGIYGVALGSYFAGESMFHHVRDASKVAVAALVQLLQAGGFSLFDVQVWSPHLGRLGAIEIDRSVFMTRLRTAITQTSDWRPEAVENLP